MHVKDKYERKVKHNMLQDGKRLFILYTQRSYVCIGCKNRFTPPVSFVKKNKQISKDTKILAIDKLKNLTLSVSQVSEDYKISDTQLHNDFLRNVDLQRLLLPKYLCIDEVFTNFRDDCKYSLVLMDFETHEIIDILPSRREQYTNSYFLGIPIQERNNVQVVISDMYHPYINYLDRYFHHAEAVVDSIHVVSWLIGKINTYFNQETRKYKDDKTSDEYYLLKRCRWLILKNEENIKDITEPKKSNKHFGYPITTEELRRKLYSVDPKLETIFELKEDYILFNNKERATLDGIGEELDELINTYKKSGIWIFEEFAETLQSHREYIIRSFTIIPSLGKSVRLSNGAMESFNRKPKDLKRLARGVENFEFFKQRVLWSERTRAKLLPIEKSFKAIQNKTEKTRGNYNKKIVNSND